MKVDGNLVDLTAHAVMVVHSIYEALAEKNEKAGKRFKTLFLKSVHLAFANDEEIEEFADSSASEVETLLHLLGETLNVN